MPKTYLIIFEEKDSLNRDNLIKELETEKKISSWFFSLPNSTFVISELSAKEIATFINSKFGTPPKKFFVTLVERSATHNYGWLPQDHWDLFSKKSSS